MSDGDYNDGVLHEKFNRIEEILNTILVQTTKTNGRVSSLEQWRAYLTGAVVVLVTLCVPIAINVVAKWILQ